MRGWTVTTVIFYILFISFPAPAFTQAVDIIWQGNVYAPPFYEGKALWSNQSLVTLVAIPQGLGNPDDLTYRWTKNGTVLGEISGIGRESMSFQDSIFSKPQIVKVEVLSVDEQILSETSITLVPIRSELLVYESNPLLGHMFHQEVVEKFKMKDDEVTFAAFPLYMSTTVRDGENLIYSWLTNGGEVGVDNSVTFRSPDSGSGSANIILGLKNNLLIMPDITRSFLVQFGESDEQ